MTDRKKKRMIVGYNFKTVGITIPGKPAELELTIPEDAKIREIAIAPEGTVVAFVEVMSHPKGHPPPKIGKRFVLMPNGAEIEDDSLGHYKTLIFGAVVFHLMEQLQPKLQLT